MNYLRIRLPAPLALVLNGREVTVYSVSFVARKAYKYDPRDEQIAVIGKTAIYIVHDLSEPRVLVVI